VRLGAAVTLERARFERNRVVGVLVAEPLSRAELTDVTIVDTENPELLAGGGSALQVLQAGAVVVNRGLFERNRFVGALVTDAGSTASFEDVRIRDTQTADVSDWGGTGLVVQEGATASFVRVAVEESRGFGLLAAAAGTEVEFESLRVAETSEQECASTTCSAASFGSSVAVAFGANVVGRGLEIASASLCGIHLVDADLDVADASIRACSVGFCVQADGYDTERALEGMVFEENGSDVEATSLPVPEPVISLPPGEGL
jgi:hypothetical protein